MSRELPILFNTDMVRAILDDRKKVTRRAVKPQQFIGLGRRIPDEYIREKAQLNKPWCDMSERELINGMYKPPCQPGDTLYVRETWCWEPCWDCGMDTDEHNCCDETAHKFFNHDKGEWGCYGYKASYEEDNVYPSVDIWHPSIHMPKEAARIWLKVTDVSVERLQNMTLDDFLSEGVVIKPEAFNDPENAYQQAKSAFKDIWDSTVKKTDQDMYGWNANPWVWVTEFHTAHGRSLHAEAGSRDIYITK